VEIERAAWWGPLVVTVLVPVVVVVLYLRER
jgi:hypothetical protein